MAIYRIDTREVSTSVAYIDAETQEEATKQAQRLIDAQRLVTVLEDTGYEEQAITAVAVEEWARSNECASAEDNAEQLEELDQDAALDEQIENPRICSSAPYPYEVGNMEHKWSDTPELNDDGVEVIKCNECGTERDEHNA